MKKMVFFKKKTLFNSFLRITLTTLLIVTTIISAAMYWYTQNTIFRDLTSYLYSAQSEMSKSMELVINDVNLASVRLLSRSQIYQLINDKSITEDEKGKLIRQELQEQLKDYKIIGDVTIVSKDGQVFRMNDDEYVALPDRAYLDGIDKAQTVTYSGGIARNKNAEPYVIIGRKLKNLDTGQYNGYLIIYLRAENLIKMDNRVLINDNFSMLVDRNGKIVASTDRSNIGETIFDYDYSKMQSNTLNHTLYKGEKMVAASTPFSQQLKNIGFDWHILTSIKEENIKIITRQISYNVWIISAISAGIAILLSIVTVAYILRPIRRLKAAMKGFKGIRQSISVNDRDGKHDEIIELERAYIDMIDRIDDLIIKNNQEKEKQRELELSALQAQINPHFLYNTLDTIVWLSKIKKQPDIEKITMALAKFFRMSLHKGDKFIMVHEEISLIQSFVIIEQMRFPSELQISYNIADEILNYPILKLILQPIVENALKHGIREKKENGKLEINGMRYEDMIILEVIDNGKGFDPTMLDEFDNLDKSKSTGYGLKNVDERIKLEYGDKYGISIYSQPDRGTTVIIKIGIKKI